MDNIKKIIALVLLGLGLTGISWYYLARNSGDCNLKKDMDSTELIYTQEEESSIKRWLNTSGDAFTLGVSKKDPVALYVQGMQSVTGSDGWPIDIELANEWLSMSASFGFAPALDQLMRMHDYDKKDPVLGLVYQNLTVSNGHLELVMFYDKSRAIFIEKLGLSAMNEIEKLAVHKMSLIYKNKKNGKFTNITDEDVLFDLEHWTGVFTGTITTGNIENWLKLNENYVRMIKRLAAKAEKTEERLNSYNFD